MALGNAMRVDHRRAFRGVCWGIFIVLWAAGSADCTFPFPVSNSITVDAKAGGNALLNVSLNGLQNPSITWYMGNISIVIWTVNTSSPNIFPNYASVLAIMNNGSLALNNVSLNYSGDYAVEIVTTGMAARTSGFTLKVFAKPVCSLSASGNTSLQYQCMSSDGIYSPLFFPNLNSSIIGNGSLSLVVPASLNLSEQEIFCIANQSTTIQQNCSIIARAPQNYLPTVSTTVNAENLVVTITYDTKSVPPDNITWSKGTQVLVTGGQYQISSDTKQLTISNFNVSEANLGAYICSSSSPFSSLNSSIQLTAPNISASSIISNSGGTMVTLTWDVPRTSVLTGFDIQMKGPNFTNSSTSNQRRKRATEQYRSITVLPSNARSKDLSVLDPKATYWFRVVPFAGNFSGQPSQEYSVGPGPGLSTAAILGLAVGIPCAVLLLLIIILLILCVVCHRRRRQQANYPTPTTSKKAATDQPNSNTPHSLPTGGIQNTNGTPGRDKGLHERHLPLPSMEADATRRMATTV